MEKTVSQLNSDGFYIGPAIADESPLEPGGFLIPGGGIDMAPPDYLEPGKRYRSVNGNWVAEEDPDSGMSAQLELPRKEHMELAARTRRDVLLERALSRMAPLQDAVDLDIATQAERSALTAWKTYRVLVNRVSEQAGYPDSIEWPMEPV